MTESLDLTDNAVTLLFNCFEEFLFFFLFLESSFQALDSKLSFVVGRDLSLFFFDTLFFVFRRRNL